MGEVVPLPERVAGQVTAAVAAAFTSVTDGRARPPSGLSMSTLGRCRRQGAYRLAGTEPSDVPPPRQGRAANLGTWVHEGLLPALAATLPGRSHVEMPVVLRAGGLEVTGRTDLYWEDGETVIDLKTVGEHRLAKVQQPSDAELVQLAGYALALVQTGMRVRAMVWLYLDRASGAERVFTAAFDRSAVLRVVERVAELARLSADPDGAPRDERGPGLSFACDECHWLRRCWGADARPAVVGPQRVLARDEAAVEVALDMYARARAAASDAERDQEFARAVFTTGSVPGTYGGWRWWQGAEQTQVDTQAAAALLEANNLPVPRKTRAGGLQVKRARPDLRS